MAGHVAPAIMASASDAHRTAASLILRNLVRYAASVGLDVDGVLRALKVSRSQLEDRDARFSLSLVERAWAAFAEASRDEAFGLKTALFYEEGAFDVVEYAASFSSDVRAALERIARFHRLLSDAAAVEIRPQGAITRVVQVVRGMHPQEQDSFFAVVCARLRSMSGVDLTPREVSFEHARSGQRALEAFFHCPVRFDRPSSEIVLASSDLDLPLRDAKPRLAAILDRYAEELLARLPATASYTDRVRRCIGRYMAHEPPTLEAIARHMHASPRTLQRKLAAEGAGHAQLVDEVRQQLALRYIDSPQLSITEIAFLLGYRDEGSFRRAFKKWTGKTPSQARRSMSPPAAR